MLDSLLTKLETDLQTSLNSCVTVTDFVATVRTHLEGTIGQVDKERAAVAEQRAKALAEIDARRKELERDTHKEAQQGRIQLNVGGTHFETSVQTLRRVPGNIFDAYFSDRYAQDLCTKPNGSIFVDRDGELFGHVLEFLRDGVVSVAEQEERPSLSLLRRLQREFHFFSIELYANQASGAERVELFDFLIAASGGGARREAG
jgi:hypothetical protein